MSAEKALTPRQRDDLRVVAAMIIPASEEYHVPGLETVNGIAEVEGNYPSKGSAGEKAAWFKDSEGNLLAIGQAVT